jgi:acetyltransferase-like isoleucine patch superfamily enzyme
MNPAQLEHDWFSGNLPDNAVLGERSWLYSSYAFNHYRSKVSVGLTVGRDTGLYHGTFFDVGPDAEIRIGDFCSLVGVIFATNGRVSIGDYTFIAHEVVIADSPWPLPGGYAARAEQKMAKTTLEIGANVWIGAHAVLIGNLRIGEGAVIGAGTLVTQDVAPYTLCAGNPMKCMSSPGLTKPTTKSPGEGGRDARGIV